MGGDYLVENFRRLVAIPSPSGSEARVAHYIKKELDAIGISSYLDGAGRRCGSDCGNLIAKLEGGRTAILFVTHMDTVEEGAEAVRAQSRRGRITSRSNTILGADNKASVSAVMSALRKIRKKRDHPTVICAFSIREESGVQGAKYLGLKGIDYAFCIDGEGRAGTFIGRSLGYMPFRIEIYGNAAHAAQSPEKGRHAIKAAALLVSRLRLGRNGRGTLNIGRISGGEKLNVVPDRATLGGEIRAFTEKDMAGIARQVKSAAKRACRSTGCRYSFINNPGENDPPFSGTGSGIKALSRAAAESLNMKFSLISEYASTESGNLAHRGYNVIGVCRGGSGAHTPYESITVKELHDLERLVISIADHASIRERP